MEKVYVVVEDGWLGNYGCWLYLIGVFDSKEEAMNNYLIELRKDE